MSKDAQASMHARAHARTQAWVHVDMCEFAYEGKRGGAGTEAGILVHDVIA